MCSCIIISSGKCYVLSPYLISRKYYCTAFVQSAREQGRGTRESDAVHLALQAIGLADVGLEDGRASAMCNNARGY